MKTKTRALSLLMTLMIVFSSLIVVPVTAEETTATIPEVWSSGGLTSIGYNYDSATKTYTIKTAQELAFFRDHVASGVNYSGFTVKLGNDIDLAGYDWTPIGNAAVAHGSNNFKGTFDGCGYTISNVTFSKNYVASATNASDTIYSTGLSFFGHLTYGAVVRNLNLEIDITATTLNITSLNGWFGGLSSAIYSAKVENCNVTVNTPSTGILMEGYNNRNFGVVGAYLQDGTNITNVNTYGDVYFKTNNASTAAMAVGGIAGRMAHATIQNCTSDVNIHFHPSITSGSTNRLGGIVGNHEATAGCMATISNCVSYGDISYSGTLNGWTGMGGIIGYTASAGSIKLTNCFSFGKLIPTAGVAHYGGAVGHYSINSSSDTVTMTNVFSSNGIENVSIYTTVNQINDAAATGMPSSNAVLGVDMDIDGGNVTVKVSRAAWDVINATDSNLTGKVVCGEASMTAPTATDELAAYFTFENATATAARLVLTDTASDWSLAVDADEKAEWTSFATMGFASGSGTSASPYVIKNAGQLAYMAASINHGKYYSGTYFELGADIDLTGLEWVPAQQIHWGYNALSIHFDGKGHTITGLTLTESSYAYTQSMFGFANGASFSNINFDKPVLRTAALWSTIPATTVLIGAMYGKTTVDNVHVTNLDMDLAPAHTDPYVSGIAGYSSDSGAKITNCSVDGKITVDTVNQPTAQTKIGGILARSNNCVIENCVNKADLTLNHNSETAGGTHRITGILGACEGGGTTTINQCVNHGTVTMNLNQTLSLGGISGIFGGTVGSGTLNVTNNVNFGEVAFNNPINSGNGYVGSIIGYSSYAATTMTGNYNLTNFTSASALPEIGGAFKSDQTHENNLSWNPSNDIYTYDGASVRIDKDAINNSGLRFDSYIYSYTYDQLMADENVSIMLGTRIAPSIMMETYGAENLPLYVEVDYDVAAYKAAGKGALDPDGNATGYADLLYVYDTENEPIQLNAYGFTGALTGILKKNYQLPFTAVSYIRITINGETHTFFENVPDEADRSRSVASVAYAALNDVYYNYDSNVEPPFYGYDGTAGTVYGNKIGEGVDPDNGAYTIYSPYSAAQREILETYIVDYVPEN